MLASTHSVQVYHPAPDDLWRWTHTGLERLFHDNGRWLRVTVRPGSGTAACVAMLIATFIDLAAKRARFRVGGKPLVFLANGAGSVLDRTSRKLREPAPGTIFANYHVVAEAPQ